jgi:poly(hydroxyalkanoate) depolymerase family esterase
MLFLGAAQPTLAATPVEVTSFGSNPGNLRMFKYVPDNLPSAAPLVVVLHGCTQNARTYAAESGWLQLADATHAALAMPEQSQANNQNLCFNWFQPGDITRDQGEALSIKQMVDQMRSDHRIDPKRIYLTGLSAGGAMTSVMLATYPEVFAAGGIVAGLPYRCASNVTDALQCMSNGHPVSWLAGFCAFIPWFCPVTSGDDTFTLPNGVTACATPQATPDPSRRSRSGMAAPTGR